MTTTTKKRTPVTMPPPAEVPASLGLDDMLGRLFGAEPAGLLRLVAGHGDSSDAEAFYRHGATADRLGSAWSWPGAQGADTPFKFTVRNSDADCRWSPLLFRAPATTGPVAIPLLWCRFPNLLVPHAQVPGYAFVESETASVVKVARLAPLPTLVLDDGRALTAFWRLNEPIASVVRAEHLLTRLAVMLGGSREAAVVARSTAFALPHLPARGIIPRRLVEARALSATTVLAEEFDAIART
jgi:hypothetical protein